MTPRVLDWEDFCGGAFAECRMAATVGAFDGLHLGHRALLEKIAAKAPALVPTVFTFKVNPKRILRPEDYEGDLISLDRKVELMGSFGVEVIVLIDFSGDFSTRPGRNFLSTVVEFGRVAYMAIGWDFHCGRGRDTDARGLKDFCGGLSVEAELLDPVSFQGDAASSTRIRRAVRAGRIQDAERLLGRPYEIELGTPIEGSGRVWRFARPANLIFPPPGIWAVAGREGEARVLIGPDFLEIQGMRESEIGRRLPLMMLGKNVAIDKE